MNVNRRDTVTAPCMDDASISYDPHMKRLAIVVAALALTVAACGGSAPEEAAAPVKKTLRFALLPKSLDIPVFNYANLGAERVAKELGVEVIYRGPDTADPTSKRIAFYGVDDFKAGQIMGEEAGKLLNGKGTVAFLTSLGANNLQRRLDGVQVGGWPVFTQRALDPVNPAKTKFISFDTVEAGPALLRSGKVQILLGQKYFGWGSESIRLLNDIVHGKMPATPIIDSGVDVVTAKNLDEYLAQFKKMESGG